MDPEKIENENKNNTVTEAPAPPPPSGIDASNIQKVLDEQYKQAMNYHQQSLKLKVELEEMRKTHEAIVKSNEDKVKNYDSLAEKYNKYKEFTSEVLKKEFESADKNFINTLDIKIDSLIEDPLNGITSLRAEKAKYDKLVETFKKATDDGTKTSPGSLSASAEEPQSYQDFLAAAKASMGIK